jgi:tetratricopeptide (TPR) repeat protein
MVLPVLLLIVSYTIATIFSVMPRTSLLGSYQRLQGTYTTFSYLVIFAVLLANLRKRRQVDRLITTIILVSMPIALYGFLQKYQLDPIPWGGNVSARIASNMGNSIFVAAYLMMVFPLTLGRIVEAALAIMRNAPQMTLNIAKTTIYMFILGLQIFALYMTQSRGPAIGWLASFLFILLMFSLRWRKRWFTLTVIGLAVLASMFLLVLNVENGPLERLRQSPAIGRFGRILDPESNNALVRKYIWQGASELISPHAPIKFPDDSQDAFNFLRPLIGYGPESMYVAFNPFYVPALGQVEKRNASPDRSHNETWDSLVITGILGFGVNILVFVSIFYFGLKWMGLIHGKVLKIIFFCSVFGGGIVGAVLLILWGGVAFFGVGLPFGIGVGLILFLVYLALTSSYSPLEGRDESIRSLYLMVLIAAVIAHFLEINFGIAIAVTRTYFWVYCALIILVGYILPRRGEFGSLGAGQPATDSQAVHAAFKFVQKGSRAKRRKEEKGNRSGQKLGFSTVGNSVVSGFVLSLILITLNFNFITNANSLTSVSEIFWSSLTRLPMQNGAVSFGILALFFTTWFFAAVIYASETVELGMEKFWFRSFIITAGISAAVSLIMGIYQAASLASLAAFSPTTDVELLEKVSRIGGLLTAFYGWVFFLLVLLGFFLVRDRLKQGLQRVKWGWIVAPLWMVMVIWGTHSTNLKVIQADIAYKMADPFVSANQWILSSKLYEYALSLAPNEDYYYLFLGKSYLEYAKTIEDDTERKNFVERAESDLKIAQKINPLNTDHTANLARLYAWWASKTDDQAVRLERGKVASKYYESALALSPNNSTLWGEWAMLSMDIFGQLEESRQKLEHAIALDPSYSFTLGLMGDYYVQVARNQADQALKDDNLIKAARYYQEAVDVAKSTENSLKIGYLVSLGNINIELASRDPGNLDSQYLLKAVNAYQDAVEAKPSANDLYRIEEQIARLYLELKDYASALFHAQASYQAAPEDQKERLNAFMAELQALP